MTRFSIRTRILLHFLVLTAFLLAAFAGLLHVTMRKALIRGLDADLRARATALAALVEKEADVWEVELEGGTRPSPDLVRILTAWSILTYPDSVVLLTSSASRDFDPPSSPRIRPPESFDRLGPARPVELAGEFNTLEGDEERAFVGLFAVREERGDDEDPDEQPGGSARSDSKPALVKIVVLADVAPIRASLRLLIGILTAIGVVTLGLAAGAGFLLSRRIVRPLARIAEDAESIRVPDRLREVHGSGTGDEIDRLAATLNRAFRRLREAYERQARFTADASHELRTPVSTIRSQAEVALRRDRTVQEYRETLAIVQEEALRLGELIEALLMMARLDSGSGDGRMRETRLDELARSGAADFAPAAQAEQVELRVTSNAEVLVRVDRHLVTIALRNLLSNALRHCSRPGSIEVRVTTTEDEAVLEVHDDGAGIPADALRHVFERFYRVDPVRDRRSGATGLGLSVVAEIARHHGGSVDVTSRPGSGTTFFVRLPLQESGESRRLRDP